MLYGDITYPKGPRWRGRIENPRTCKKYIDAQEITTTQTGLGCLASAVVETEKRSCPIRVGWMPCQTFAKVTLCRTCPSWRLTGDGRRGREGKLDSTSTGAIGYGYSD